MNPYQPNRFPSGWPSAAGRAAPAQRWARDVDGRRRRALAFNEVSPPRKPPAAKLRIIVDGVVRIDELMADGSPRGRRSGRSTKLANLSAHGPIILLGAAVLALTPISAFRPRRWRARCCATKRRSGSRRSKPTTPGQRRRRLHRGARVMSLASTSTKTAGRRPAFLRPRGQLEERVFKEQFAT